MSANPVYEIHPPGLRLVGRDAVREFYRRSFAVIAPKVKARRERAFGHGDNLLMTEAAYTMLVDGAQHLGRSVTVVTFDESDRLVCCERTYLATPHQVALFEETLGSDFRELPGAGYADEKSVQASSPAEQ